MASLLRLLDRAQSQKLLARLGQADIDIDFGQFSALTQPQQPRYDCSIASLLD